jgi:hypothetical protein
MTSRWIVAIVSFFVFGFVSLILFGFAVSALALNFNSVLFGAFVVGVVAGVVGFYRPEFAAKVLEILNF